MAERAAVQLHVDVEVNESPFLATPGKSVEYTPEPTQVPIYLIPTAWKSVNESPAMTRLAGTATERPTARQTLATAKRGGRSFIGFDFVLDGELAIIRSIFLRFANTYICV
jgi:hypothetical protein